MRRQKYLQDILKIIDTTYFLQNKYSWCLTIQEAIEEEAAQKANEKVHVENLSRNELLGGKTLREVYNKYKAL